MAPILPYQYSSSCGTDDKVRNNSDTRYSERNTEVYYCERNTKVKHNTSNRDVRSSLTGRNAEDRFNASDVAHALRNYSNVSNYNETLRALENNVNLTFVDRLLYIDNIIERFNYVHNKKSNETFATPATIVSVDCNDLEYPAGTRCLLISYEAKDNYSAIAFLDVNEEGNITRIYITTDGRYHFRADES